MSYRDREIISRWTEGEAPSSISEVMRMTLDEVLSVINRNRN